MKLKTKYATVPAIIILFFSCAFGIVAQTDEKAQEAVKKALQRMMMVYAPEYHLFYGSDLVQLQPDGTFFMPQYINELISAAKRENLKVEKVFAMHAEVLPWSNLEKVFAPN